MTASLRSFLTPQEYRQLQVAKLEAKADGGAGQGAAASDISLTDFKAAFFRRYIPADHLNALDHALTQVTRYVETDGREGFQNLLISMPRRYGKTLTLGRFFPPWYLQRNPDHRIIMASYGASLVERTSRLARNVILSPRYQQMTGLALEQGSKSVSSWNIAGHEGGLDAMGVMGGATGKGFHIFIGDDLLKNREEAESETIRDKVWSELQDSYFSGADVAYAGRIICATRWHQDDPIGRLLSLQGDRWHYLKLPAIAGKDDYLGRPEGAPLWERKHTARQLHQIETDVGPYSWASLWQQEPTPAEGGVFKRRWFEGRIDRAQLPAIVRQARFWDLAMSSKTSADYTVGTLIAECEDGHFYILDVARAQIEWGDVTPFLATVMLDDGPTVPQGIEEKGFMSRAVTDLNLDARLRNYQVWGYPKDTDKLTNALPFAAKCAAGAVHLVKAHWNETWLDELCAFNAGAHDDQVDSAAGAYHMMSDGAGSSYGAVYYEDDRPIVDY
jgi:predicted phage terminase large subunit-like protein